MLAEIARRLVATIPVMGVVAIAVFALLHVTPGDPAVIIAGDYATSDDIARIRTRLGLAIRAVAQDAETARRNDEGDSSHERYKRRQLQRVEPGGAFRCRDAAVKDRAENPGDGDEIAALRP